eukprot:GHVN01085393.1.p1 GENE.GHVN01085393.1~~GHVN01085393.1.p1  ORF type:complete len:377 (-),score=23.33 GHVN01085393.1:1500-2630(-)
MPFGPTNAPSHFMRVMSVALSGLDGTWAYLDDIIFGSVGWKELLEKLSRLMLRLRHYRLYIKIGKAKIGWTEAKVLGHVVSAEGIRKCQDGVEALMKAKRPTTLKELRSLLGVLSVYRMYVRDFAVLVEPMAKLVKGKLRRTAATVWGDKEDAALSVMLEALEADVVLQYPNWNAPFRLETDASDVGMGAVLSQEVEGEWRPVEFASKLFSDVERRWSTREKEAYAIVWAVCCKFQHFLRDAISLDVFTHHQNLRWLWDSEKVKIGRWALRLQEFLFAFSTRRGGRTRCQTSVGRWNHIQRPRRGPIGQQFLVQQWRSARYSTGQRFRSRHAKSLRRLSRLTIRLRFSVLGCGILTIFGLQFGRGSYMYPLRYEHG